MNKTDEEKNISVQNAPENPPETGDNTDKSTYPEEITGVNQTDGANDSFDYVIPDNPGKHRKRHKRRSSSHRSHTKTATTEELEDEEEGYIFASPVKKKRSRSHHHRRKFRHLPLWQRILIIAGVVLLSLIIALAGTFAVLHEIGRNSMHNYETAELEPPAQDESGNEIVLADKNGHVITYDGVSYQLNKDLVSVVFIGVDEGTETLAGKQMADAIYILTADTKTGKVKILSVSRDTMADVDVYSSQGKFIETQQMQLAFSYEFSGTDVTGGKNTTTSLSRLFYSLPFENYFAINMDALITLNDTIGGVTLTSSITFTSPIDNRVINAGDTVTLHGKEADYYVRSRDTEQLASNNDRMKRQQEYISAFMAAIVPAVKKDTSLVSELYDEIRVNSETSLDLAEMTYLTSTAVTKLRSAADIEYVSLTGTITEGEFAEMHVKNEDAIRTMLDVFYTPLAEVPDTAD